MSKIINISTLIIHISAIMVLHRRRYDDFFGGIFTIPQKRVNNELNINCI